MSAHYQEFPPAKRLQQFVECLWAVEASGPVAEYPVLPDGCVDIVCSPGTASGLQVVGTMTHAHRFSLRAGQQSFGMRFRPGMSSAFLPIPGIETTDQSLPLSDVWGSEARRLNDQIAVARSARECVGLLEASLHDPGVIGLVEQLCAWIVQQAGRVRVDDLSRKAGLSARQLRRLFLERVGLSPKHFCRIIRFRSSVSRITEGCSPEWAQTALACGYYDQAHFINEFHEFSGYSPGEFVSLDR
jgi:AraC-like DNA-binding protein